MKTRNPSIITKHLVVAMNAILLLAANGGIIAPTSWKQSNAITAPRTAGNLSNAAGMDTTETILYNQNTTVSAPGETAGADGKYWATSSKVTTPATLGTEITAGKVWIVADLGASKNLTTVKIWNFQWQSGSTNLANRGVSQFDILVRNTDADTDDGTAGGTAINPTSVSDLVGAISSSPVFNLGTTAPWTIALENQALTQAPNNDTYTGQTFILPPSTTARFIAIRVDSFYGGAGIGLGKVRIEGETDTSAPLLMIKNPSDDATSVATGSNLGATFNEAVQAGTGNITIKKTSDNSEVEIFNVASSPQLTFSAKQVTINPTANLEVGIGYYVQIDSTAILDLSGNAYAGIFDPDTTSWSFTSDNTPPVLTSLSPATPTKAHAGTRLMAQFNESVQAGTGTVTIYKASDDSLVETVDVTTPGAIANNGGVIAIVRSVVLEPNTAYYVNASAGAVQDISGNPAAAITGTSAWTFTTTTAVPLVVENFNGSSSPLNGTTADTFAAAITTAGGSSTWGAASGFLENGAASATASSLAFLNLGTFINATKGTSAGKFELTMTIGETTGSWISLGFATNPTPAIGQNFTTIGGLGTILYRAQKSSPTPGELDMFGGPNNTNVVDGPDSNSGFRTLTVTLDLTPAGGYNGTGNYGTVTWSDSAIVGNLGSHTYTTTRDFGSLLISLTNSTGTINALALYQAGTPSNTYANWIGTFNVDGLIGTNGDFDNDSLPNAVENLLGTSPEVFSQGLTSVSSNGGNLVFRHTLSTTPASDLTGAYEWSTDLVTWNASGVPADGTTVTFGDPVVITEGTPDLVEVTATVTGTPSSKIFARFKATQN